MYISFFSDYTDRMIVWQPGNISRLSDGEKLIFLGKEEIYHEKSSSVWSR